MGESGFVVDEGGGIMLIGCFCVLFVLFCLLVESIISSKKQHGVVGT